MIHAFRHALICCALLTLAGCSSIVYKPMAASAPGPHKIVIFFDGTHNDIASDTNVKRLHSLVSLQDKRNISSIYIEGVGVENDVIGAGTGFGMAPRVEIAYEFILNHYRPDDQIYIFGFSRGAYAARILASMLYNAGVVKKGKTPSAEVADITSFELAKTVFDVFKYRLEEDQEKTRKVKVKADLEAKGLEVSGPISVEVLGLWDTVEAMGIPEWPSRIMHKLGIKQHVVNIDASNTRYGDQLCNVKRAYQAVSIDDNREWIFTPLLLDRTHLFRNCAADGTHLLGKDGLIKPGQLRQVWFSGAHADVGGGYADSQLSGVSLNWMIGNLADTDLLPTGARVVEDPFGNSHDPESGWWGPLYHAVNRDIPAYMEVGVPPKDKRRRAEFGNILCVHSSVLARRATVPLKDHENDLLILRQEGDAILLPGPADHDGWKPRLHEIKVKPGKSPPPNSTKLVVEVWPECTGMKP